MLAHKRGCIEEYSSLPTFNSARCALKRARIRSVSSLAYYADNTKNSAYQLGATCLRFLSYPAVWLCVAFFVLLACIYLVRLFIVAEYRQLALSCSKQDSKSIEGKLAVVVIWVLFPPE